jgi:sugar phosphate isomerase/epimerase
MSTPRIDRRTFLQTTGTAALGAAMMGWTHSSRADNEGKGAPHAEKLGWRLGCQAWTFHDVTFYDAIDKTSSLGLHYIEAFPGQKLSPSQTDVKVGPEMSEAIRKEVKQRLSDKGIKMVSFGVVHDYTKTTFDFAKDMGIENIVAEPAFDAFDAIDKLCEEYQTNLAIHDHPKPSPYWNPDTVLKVCKGHSKRIGACCDTGHWMRSGINPLEALKKLEGRIIEFHFKDLNENSPDAHDVPWGTGKGDIKALLTEVHRQGIKPVFSVEYEYHYGTSLPEIAQSVAYFDKVAAELGG